MVAVLTARENAISLSSMPSSHELKVIALMRSAVLPGTIPPSSNPLVPLEAIPPLPEAPTPRPAW